MYRSPGLHGDRPIPVDERIPMRAGTYALDLRFAPAEEQRGAPLPVFALQGALTLERRQIRVVSLNDGSRRFQFY